MQFVSYLISFLFLGKFILAYDVLGIFPLPFKSHYIGAETLMRSLAADGHHVTVISPFPQKKSLPNFVDHTLDGMDEALNNITSTIFTKKATNNFERLDFLYELGVFYTHFILTHHRMVEFIKRKNQHFDVVILEVCNNAAMIGLGQHFNAPVIGYTPMDATMWNKDMVGTPAPISIVPHQLMLSTDRMSFVQRLENTLIIAYDYYKFHHHLKLQNEIYQKVFLDINKPTINELQRSVSLVLVNHHFTINHPQPYATNMIEVGGLHINRDKPKSLPDDIKQFVEEAPNGVIYFSFGSIVKGCDIPTAQRDGLLRAFSKLKERVLWKWEDPDLPEKADNVMISSWFPQESILAHPNVKLFISHGGLLSIMEAIYHSVPIIGIPLFGDHFLNMFRAQSAGYGLTVSLANLTECTIVWAIDEILNNEKYLLTVKEMSNRFRDVPMGPLDLAKYWVEYVVRHKGAPQLRSAGQDLSLVAYHNLDVFFFLICVIGCAFIGLTMSFRIIVGGISVIRKSSRRKLNVNKKAC